MSEIRDIAAALESLGNRFTLAEECLTSLVRDSAQQSEWRHMERNIAQRQEGFEKATGSALKQIHSFMGDFSSKLAEIVARLDAYGITRQDDVKRIAGLERRITQDEEENTQP